MMMMMMVKRDSGGGMFLRFEVFVVELSVIELKGDRYICYMYERKKAFSLLWGFI